MMLKNIQFQLLNLFLKVKILSLIKDPTNKQEDQLNVINLIFEKFSLNNLLKKFLNFFSYEKKIFLC